MPTFYFEKPAASSSDRIAAAIMAAGAAMAIALVSHHPVLGVGQDAHAISQAMTAISSMNEAIHGGLMIVVVSQILAFYYLARRLGLSRPIVVAGGVFYVSAALLLIMAMTFDGFVTADYIATCDNISGACDAFLGPLRLVSSIIQAFTRLAFSAEALALLCWSLAFFIAGGKVRLIGLAGAIVAIVPLALLFGSAIDPHRLVQILFFPLIWQCGAAAMLASGRFAPMAAS